MNYTADKQTLSSACKIAYNKSEAERKRRSRANDNQVCLNLYTGKTYAQTSNVKRKVIRDKANGILPNYYTAALRPPDNYCNFPLAACYQDEETKLYVVYNITILKPKKKACFPRLLAYKITNYLTKETALSRLEAIQRGILFVKTDILVGEESNEYLFNSIINVPGRAIWKYKI